MFYALYLKKNKKVEENNMKKLTTILATILTTTFVAFSHCRTVDAGMFKPDIPEPYGFYTITPDCVYKTKTNNNYIDSVYLVTISQAGDNVELTIEDEISDYYETYKLSRGFDVTSYDTWDDDGFHVSINYYEEYSQWFLTLEDTVTCLEPITWQYSYTPIINESDWGQPIGYYYDDEDGELLFVIYDLYRTGFYAAKYYDFNGNCNMALLDIEWQTDSALYTIDNLGTMYMDDTFCEFYFDDGNMTTLTKEIPYSYNNIDTFEYIEIDAPCIVGNEYYATIHIEFEYSDDEFGCQLKYYMSSEFWDEEFTGYAIITYDGYIISNDFIFTNDLDNLKLAVPKVMPYAIDCDFDVIMD